MRSATRLPDAWSYGPEARPPRSLLPSIEPIGVGTPLCEDLASYFSRVAWSQGRAPSRLVRDVLADGLAAVDASAATARDWMTEFDRLTARHVASVVGHAPAAATWADALAAATGRSDLRALTLLPWSEVLPWKGLLRRERAWCVVCLEHWRVVGHAIYTPMLWQFAAVTICPIHEVQLAATCHACGGSAGVVTHWARPGWCKCGEWLGRAWVHEDELPGGDELDWQRFVTHEVGSLIASTAGLPGPPTAAHTAAAVRLCWSRTGLSLTRLSAQMGMALSTLSLWKDGRRQPSLPGALRLCRLAGTKLVPFLQGDLIALAEGSAPDEPPYVPPSEETHRAIDWEAVEERLNVALREEPPVSLAEALRRAAVDNRQAKGELPQLCAALATRYRDFVDARLRERRVREAELVATAIAQAVGAGVYPSRHQVQKRLPANVSLRSPHLHRIWADTARDPARRFGHV